MMTILSLLLILSVLASHSAAGEHRSILTDASEPRVKLPNSPTLRSVLTRHLLSSGQNVEVDSSMSAFSGGLSEELNMPGYYSMGEEMMPGSYTPPMYSRGMMGEEMMPGSYDPPMYSGDMMGEEMMPGSYDPPMYSRGMMGEEMMPGSYDPPMYSGDMWAFNGGLFEELNMPGYYSSGEEMMPGSYSSPMYSSYESVPGSYVPPSYAGRSLMSVLSEMENTDESLEASKTLREFLTVDDMDTQAPKDLALRRLASLAKMVQSDRAASRKLLSDSSNEDLLVNAPKAVPNRRAGRLRL